MIFRERLVDGIMSRGSRSAVLCRVLSFPRHIDPPLVVDFYSVPSHQNMVHQLRFLLILPLFLYFPHSASQFLSLLARFEPLAWRIYTGTLGSHPPRALFVFALFSTHQTTFLQVVFRKTFTSFTSPLQIQTQTLRTSSTYLHIFKRSCTSLPPSRTPSTRSLLVHFRVSFSISCFRSLDFDNTAA